ncbi:MAG: glutamate racemase [Edaphobacter sp.]|nr:glutamate racemase [Edaphobacter sp.]
MNNTNPTIGVFDSGFGGLTVLRALLPLIPGANYIYLGDTARLPYGSKSRETITRYALSSAKFLQDQGAGLLVIACNTASALALEELQQTLPIPVIGVIQPGAQAALATASRTKKSIMLTPSDPNGKNPRNSPIALQRPKEAHALVLATAATTQSRAYTHALAALGLRATEKACPLLVPLVEEGWIDHPVTAEVLRIYLLEALAQAPDASILLLGCTHYPLLKPLIETTLHNLHHPMRIIDSAEATAQAVTAHLSATTSSEPPTCTFYATDSIEKFQRLGSNFLGQPLKEVHLLDLGG